MKFMSQYIRKEVLELKAYQLASHPEAVKLNQNEIPQDIPGELKAQVLEKLVRIPWNRYPHYQPFALREKLSQILSWIPEGILITNGSNVLIQSIMLATAVGGRVLTLDPTFGLYEINARAFGNEVQLMRLGENFSFPKEEILRSIAEAPPNIIIFPNPNAPTGNLFPREEILSVVQAAPCLVVLDEAYYQFADSNFMEEARQQKNLLLLRTFSKAWGLGGVRIGYAVGAPEVIQEISKVTVPYCLNALSESVAEAVLDHPEIVERRLTEIKIERARVYQSLASFSEVKAYPSQTNFIIFQTPDSSRVFEALLKEGVLIRDVSNPRSLPNALRVTIGLPVENEKFLKALEKVIRSM